MAGAISPETLISVQRNATASGSRVVESSSSPIRARMSCAGRPSSRRSRKVWKKYACSMYSSRSSTGIGGSPPGDGGRSDGASRRGSAPRDLLRLARSTGREPLDDLRSHFPVQARGQRGVEDGAVIPVGDDLDDRVAAQPGQRILEQLHRAFEVKRIEAAGDHPQLPFE